MLTIYNIRSVLECCVKSYYEMKKSTPKCVSALKKTKIGKDTCSGSSKRKFTKREQYLYTLLAANTSVIETMQIFAIVLRYQGGLPVILFMLIGMLIGIPLVMCQMLLAQYSKTNKVFRIAPLFIGTQYIMGFLIFVQALTEMQHVRIMMQYVQLIIGNIDWNNCSSIAMDDDLCKDSVDEETKYMTCCNHMETIDKNSCQVHTDLNTASEKFFEYVISSRKYSRSDHVADFRDTFNTTVAWIIAYLLAIIEMKYFMKWVKFVVLLFIITCIFMLILSLNLPGATVAMATLTQIRLDNLKFHNIYGDSYIMILAALEVCTGVIIEVTIWIQETRNIVTDAAYLCLCKLLISFLCLMVTMALVGISANKYMVTDIDCFRKMLYKGSNYALISEMVTLTYFPHFLLFIFFLVFSLMQHLHIVFLTITLTEQFTCMKRWLSVLLFCTIATLCAIPVQIYKRFVNYVFLRHIFLPLIQIIIVLAFSLAAFIIYGTRQLCDDMNFMLGYPPSIYLRYSWYLTTPVVICLTLAAYFTIFDLMTIQVEIKSPKVPFRVLPAAFVGIIVIGMIIQVCWYSVHSKISDIFKPHKLWGPEDYNMRLERHFAPQRVEAWKDHFSKCKHMCLRDSPGIRHSERLLQARRRAYMDFTTENAKSNKAKNPKSVLGSQTSLNEDI